MSVRTRHETPVGFATLNGHQGVVQILLGYGSSCANAFLYAASACKVHLLRCLLQEFMNFHIPASTWWKIFRKAMDAAISYKSPTIISILIEFDVSIDVPVGSRRVSTAEDHVLWLSDIVILLGVDFRTRSVGHSSGKERSRISIKGEVLITKRTWKWIGKYLWRAVKRQGFPWAQIPAPLLENRNIINYNLLLLFFFFICRHALYLFADSLSTNFIHDAILESLVCYCLCFYFNSL